jgi:hypothetical protein
MVHREGRSTTDAGSRMKVLMNDNEMSDLQRILALELQITKMRTDLASCTDMLERTPANRRLVKQKGAIEKLIFMALVEIGKLRKRSGGAF